MARRLISAAELAAIELESTLGTIGLVPKKRKRSTARHTKVKIQNLVNGMGARMAANDWDFDAADTVALYVWCHRETYGVAPLDVLAPATFGKARMQSAKQCREHFGDCMEDQLAFMRWVWRREQSREVWRRENKSGGRVLNWYGQFVGSQLVTEYRVQLARETDPHLI